MSHFDFIGKSIETETTKSSEFPNRAKSIVEQILSSKESNKFKRAEMWESQSGISVEKLIISVKSFEVEKLQKSLLNLSVPPE